MSDLHEQQPPAETEREEALADLDIDAEEAEKVKGGRRSSDPCEGGE